MKSLLATTAIVVALAGAVAAQTTTAPGFVASAGPMDVRGSDLIGATVYAADYEGDAQSYFRGPDARFESIGDIQDVLLTREGDVRAVLVDVGGFLGVGAKTVAVGMASLEFVTESDDADDWRIVIDGSRATLEAAPAYEEPEARARRAAAPLIMREGWTRAEPAAMTVENLEGVAVYDLRDENIGAIADFVLTDQGGIEAAVIDVGGFLGMGAHRVAVPFEQVNILREAEGDDFRAYVDADEERLRAMPSFEG